MSRPKRLERKVDKEKRYGKKDSGDRGKRKDAVTSTGLPPDVDSEPAVGEDNRPTILQIRNAELIGLFVPLVLLVVLITYIVSTSYGLLRIKRALADSRGSTVTNVASPFGDQIAGIARLAANQSDSVRSLADAFRVSPDRAGDNERLESNSPPILPAVDSQLERLQERISAMRSRIADFRSIMSEQEARDPYPGTWAKSQDWGIVLFNSTEGYNAKYLYPSVEEFFAAYGSTGDYSINVIGAESQQVKLIQAAVRGTPVLQLDPDDISDPSPGTTEKPDEIVADILRRFPLSENRPQCLLIVSGRCPIPNSDQWQKFRVHVCVLDDQSQPGELRNNWQDFCRRHGSGLCEIVPYRASSKIDIRAAGGRIRGWIESALRSPPPPPSNQATSADGKTGPFTRDSGE